MKQFDTYIKLLPTVQDKDGFIQSDTCDSLLFSALVGCVPRTSINIDAAFDGKQWHRRPCSLPECFPDHSKSSISRDMIIGLLWYAWCNGRLDISESIVNYALKHYGIMGKGVLSRTLISPSLLGTAAWISYQLGGPSRSILRMLPVVGSLQTGYQEHLDILHTLLRDKVTGSPDHLPHLLQYAERDPHNALAQVAAGRITEALEILSWPSIFPENSLPTARDGRISWLWERDYLEWNRGAASNKVYSGGDYLFVYALAAEMI